LGVIRSGELVTWWDQGGGRLAVGPEPLAVQEQLGVELARPPRGQHLLDGGHVGAEEAGDRPQVGRQGDDRADIQVAGGVAVQPVTDARRERIVDGGVAQGALDAHRAQTAARVEEPGDANHRLQLKQCQRDRRVVQVDLAPLEGLLQLGRQGVDIDLQPDPERRLWAQAGPDAAIRSPGDRPMELQSVAPELLVAEGVEAEDLTTPVDEPRRLRLHRLIAAGRLWLLPGR
jgi:hypothetical protein